MGATVAIFGSTVFAEPEGGHVLALLTVAMTVVVAVLFRDLALLAIGALGSLLILPRAVDRFFPGVLAVPAGLLLAGSLLVGIALAMSRRQGVPATTEAQEYTAGPAGLSIALASGAIAVTATAVLLLGLE